MPIKFRCQHCDHLLGISRKKAGEQVDCPACGRAIRVPDLDGITRPLEEQQMQTNDPKLIDAFRELDEIERNPQPIKMESRVKVSGLMLNPLAKNVPKELGVIPATLPVKNEDSDEIDVYEELKPIIMSSPSQRTKNRQESHNNTSWIALTSVLVLLAFSGGYYVGAYHPFHQQAEQKQAITEKLIFAKEPATNPLENYVIKGQISYKQPSGEVRPDRGARIFLLPQKYAGAEKLPAFGFRAGDTIEDFQKAQSALEKLGGLATIVKDDGRYELSVKENGEYSLVIVSRFADRTDNEIISALVIPILIAFFEKPNEVIGKVGCHGCTLSLKKIANIDLDYVFAP